MKDYSMPTQYVCPVCGSTEPVLSWLMGWFCSISHPTAPMIPSFEPLPVPEPTTLSKGDLCRAATAFNEFGVAVMATVGGATLDGTLVYEKGWAGQGFASTPFDSSDAVDTGWELVGAR